MALVDRQLALYTSSLNIYREVPGTPSGGVVPDPTFRVVVSGVPCYYDYTQNDDDPTPALGRVKRRTALTEDEIHVEVDTDVQSGDYTRDVTVSSPSFGTVHRIMGGARQIPSHGNRQANVSILRAMESELVPPELEALF